MKKEEKKKVVKKAPVESKKELKKVEKVEEKSKDSVVFGHDIKKGVRVLAIFTVFIAVIASIFVFVFGIIISLKAANQTKTELLHDNFTVTFISNINGTSITDAENIIEGYGSKTLFLIFDIILPAVAFITIMILLIIFAKQLLDFVNDVTSENELFTKAKLLTVEKLLCIVATILTISLIIFGKPSVLIFAFISALLFIIIGLFNKCIEYRKNR